MKTVSVLGVLAGALCVLALKCETPRGEKECEEAWDRCGEMALENGSLAKGCVSQQLCDIQAGKRANNKTGADFVLALPTAIANASWTCCQGDLCNTNNMGSLTIPTLLLLIPIVIHPISSLPHSFPVL